MRSIDAKRCGALAIALAACTQAPPAAMPAPTVSAAPIAPPPDPCAEAAAQRTRVKDLLAAGKIDRTLRVIQAADAICPASAPSTWAAELDALVAIGKLDEAKARAVEIERDPRAGDDVRAAAARAREAKPDGEPVEAIIAAGRADRAAGRAAEAQRRFDRAAARIEKQTGERLVLQVRNGLEASAGLPWSSNGGIFPRSLSVIYASPVISADGKRAVMADGKRVLVIDRAAHRMRLRLSGHEANVTALAISPDSKTIASGGYDSTIRLWDAITGKPGPVITIDGAARALRFVRQGAVLVASHEEASAWDVATGKLLGRVAAAEATAGEIDPDGAVTATDTGVPKQRIDPLTSARLPGAPPRAEVYARDGSLGALAFPGRLEIRRFPGAKKVRAINLKANVAHVWMSADGRWIAAGLVAEDDGPVREVRIFRADNGKPAGGYKLEGEAYGYDIRGFTERGQPVLGSGSEQTVIDPATGKPIRKLAPAERVDEIEAEGLLHDDALTPDAMAFSADGKTLALALHHEVGEEWPQRLVLVDAAAGTLRDVPVVRPIGALRFLSPQRLLAWHYAVAVTLDLATGKLTTLLESIKQPKGILHVTASGRFAVGYTGSGETGVFDLSTGERVAGTSGKHSFAGEHANGGLFFAEDGNLTLLDPATGKLTMVTDTQAEWSRAATTRDGRAALVTQREGRTVRLAVLPLPGGALRPIGEPVEDVAPLVPIAGDSMLVHTTEGGAERTRLLDVAKGTFTRVYRSELWEGGSMVASPDQRVFSDTSRPEALFAFWPVGQNEPSAVLRVLAEKNTAYVYTSDGHLEVIGNHADVLDGHAYCQAGPRVYPAVVCEERYLTRGVLTAVLAGETAYRAP